MPKSLALGNGNILVCFDKYAQVRDLYFPYVGLENHVGSTYVHRIGVWVDGNMRWLSHNSWKVSVNCEKNTLVSNIKATNRELGIDLDFSDVVYNEKDIFIRKVIVYNKGNSRKEIKIYFGHEFEIYESKRGDTSYFEPIERSIIHYNGRRVFLINGRCDNRGFDDYTTGIFKIEGKEGSYKDAEDGMLTQNPIEHGLSDSVIGFYFSISPNEKKEVYYWMTISETIKGAKDLDDYVVSKSPEHLLRTTKDFWNAWVNKYNFSFYGLNENIVLLFNKSLFNIRAHTDNRGAIIASGDFDMLQKGGRDTYGYMWPRDGAFSAMALDRAGDTNVVRRFFSFCNNVITDDGYFMHKYRPDESLGSSWHPWVRDGEVRLPIQEDETALVLYSLWKHYEVAKDLEFIEDIYNSLIKKAADFMVLHRDKKTGLPKPSYDLWEEKFGISTFSSSSVYAALISASKFATIFGKEKSAAIYRETAEEISQAIMKYLYNEKTGNFYKMINFKDDKIIYDETLDMSSVYGIYEFGILDVDDDIIERAIKNTKEKLICKTEVSGVVRYEGDLFHRTAGNVPGNPWFITTLWLAQYYIQKAKKESDFDEVKKWLNWVVDNSRESGVLSEQIDPYSGEQLSAAPLTWSHSELVITVLKYLDKMEELGICKKCDPLRVV